jgi:hypothetical protein
MNIENVLKLLSECENIEDFIVNENDIEDNKFDVFYVRIPCNKINATFEEVVTG